jgi:hypothetical protein
MKKKLLKFALAISAVSLLAIAGCKKDELPSKVVVVSHPTVTLQGDPVVILNVGDTYSDQGATYYDSLYGDQGTLTATTEVNTSEEGFFVVRYTATNQYGHEGSGTRLVAVTGIDDAFDVSGTYIRVGTGGEATVSKVGRGVFVTTNVAGGGTPENAYFMFKSDSTMVMPEQFLPAFAASADFVDPVYDFNGTPPNYSYIIDNPAVFGAAVRVFEKQ